MIFYTTGYEDLFFSWYCDHGSWYLLYDCAYHTEGYGMLLARVTTILLLCLPGSRRTPRLSIPRLLSLIASRNLCRSDASYTAFTVVFLSLKSINKIPLQSQKIVAMTFFVDWVTLAFLGGASPGLRHSIDSPFSQRIIVKDHSFIPCDNGFQ